MVRNTKLTSKYLPQTQTRRLSFTHQSDGAGFGIKLHLTMCKCNDTRSKHKSSNECKQNFRGAKKRCAIHPIVASLFPVNKGYFQSDSGNRGWELGATSVTTVKIPFSALDFAWNVNFHLHLLNVFKTKHRRLSNHGPMRTSQLGLFLCPSAHASTASLKTSHQPYLSIEVTLFTGRQSALKLLLGPAAWLLMNFRFWSSPVTPFGKLCLCFFSRFSYLRVF
jgi:hypothetical protein